MMFLNPFFPLPLLFPTFFPSTGAVRVRADSRCRGGERHPEGASSVKAPQRPPPRLRSIGSLCQLQTATSLSASLRSSCLSTPPLPPPPPRLRLSRKRMNVVPVFSPGSIVEILPRSC